MPRDPDAARRIRNLHRAVAVIVAVGVGVCALLGGIGITTEKINGVKPSLGFQEALLQWYMFAFCFMAILGECRIEKLLKIFGLLRTYFGRAMFYLLIGSLGILFWDFNKITFGAGVVIGGVAIWTFGIACSKQPLEEAADDDDEDDHGVPPQQHYDIEEREHDEFGEDEPGAYNAI